MSSELDDVTTVVTESLGPEISTPMTNLEESMITGATQLSSTSTESAVTAESTTESSSTTPNSQTTTANDKPV